MYESWRASAESFVHGTGLDSASIPDSLPVAGRRDRSRIDKARIPYEGILIPDEGRLVDFHAAEMLFA